MIHTIMMILFIFSSCSEAKKEEKIQEIIDEEIVEEKEEYTPKEGEVYADWEKGDWQSGFTGNLGPIASFSIIGVMNSQVVVWNPEPQEGFDSTIHGMEVVKTSENNYLKIWSDGRNRNLRAEKFWDENTPYSNRTEISWNKYLVYDPGDEVFLTYDFKPGDSWDEYTKQYPTIITQFKEFASGPFVEILLSNSGLNANNNLDIFVKGGKLIQNGTTSKTFDLAKISEINPDQWSQIKMYVKASTKSDGVIKVWINGGNNGEPNFSYSGRTLLVGENGNRSYTKIGHYGQIYNIKTSYFDNVHMTKEIDTSLKEWALNTSMSN